MMWVLFPCIFEAMAVLNVEKRILEEEFQFGPLYHQVISLSLGGPPTAWVMEIQLSPLLNVWKHILTYLGF